MAFVPRDYTRNVSNSRPENSALCPEVVHLVHLGTLRDVVGSFLVSTIRNGSWV